MMPIPTSTGNAVNGETVMTDTEPECMCIARINSMLREHNSYLVTNLFGKPRAIIATTKFDEKKRGKPKMMFASFCPFCGVKYAADEVR